MMKPFFHYKFKQQLNYDSWIICGARWQQLGRWHCLAWCGKRTWAKQAVDIHLLVWYEVADFHLSTSLQRRENAGWKSSKPPSKKEEINHSYPTSAQGPHPVTLWSPQEECSSIGPWRREKAAKQDVGLHRKKRKPLIFHLVLDDLHIANSCSSVSKRISRSVRGMNVSSVLCVLCSTEQFQSLNPTITSWHKFTKWATKRLPAKGWEFESI